MASIKELLNFSPDDINRMNRKELSKVVSQLSSASNKRLKRLGSTDVGQMSPAYNYMSTKGKFSVKGKTTNQLRNEYVRNKNFLNRKTSTVSGWKEVRKESFKRIGGDFGGDLSSEQEFWKTFRMLEQNGFNNAYGFDSHMTQRMLRNEMRHYSGDELMLHMESLLRDTYDEMQNQYQDEVSDDEFYSFDDNYDLDFYDDLLKKRQERNKREF